METQEQKKCLFADEKKRGCPSAGYTCLIIGKKCTYIERNEQEECEGYTVDTD